MSLTYTHLPSADSFVIFNDLYEYESIKTMHENRINIKYMRQNTEAMDSVEYYQRLADSYFLEKNYFSAAINYIQGLICGEGERQSQKYYQGWGNKQFRNGVYENIADIWYLKRISEDKRIQNPENALGICLSEIDYEDEALLLKVQQKMQKIEGNQNIDCLLGHFYYNKGKYEQAESYFAKHKEFDHCLVGLGLIYKKRRSLSDAKHIFQKAVEINPRNAFAWLQLISIQGNINKKKQYLSKQCLSVGYSKVHLLSGKMYIRQKNLQSALQQFYKALEENQFIEECYTWIGKAVVAKRNRFSDKSWSYYEYLPEKSLNSQKIYLSQMTKLELKNQELQKSLKNLQISMNSKGPSSDDKQKQELIQQNQNMKQLLEEKTQLIDKLETANVNLKQRLNGTVQSGLKNQELKILEDHLRELCQQLTIIMQQNLEFQSERNQNISKISKLNGLISSLTQQFPEIINQNFGQQSTNSSHKENTTTLRYPIASS